MRVIRRVLTQRIVTGGIDRVVNHLPLPEGAVLNNAWINQHFIGSEETGIHKFDMYATSGVVLAVPEPDTALNIDSLWDNVVPKDAALGTDSEDLDTENPDSSQVYEMGIINPSEIIDGGTNIRRFFKRQVLMTALTSKLLVPAATVAAFVWYPHDQYTAEMKPKIRASVPSMAMVATGNPLGTSTTTTIDLTPTGPQWSAIRYIEEALREAFIHLLGFVEAGAGTPYDTMAGIVADLIEPVVTEETAGAFETGTSAVVTLMTWDFTVPGTFDQGTLNSES